MKEDGLAIRAAACVLGATLKAGETAENPLGDSRHGYLVSSTGSVEVKGVHVDIRDGAAIRDEAVVRVTAVENSELVLVDVA